MPNHLEQTASQQIQETLETHRIVLQLAQIFDCQHNQNYVEVYNQSHKADENLKWTCELPCQFFTIGKTLHYHVVL